MSDIGGEFLSPRSARFADRAEAQVVRGPRSGFTAGGVFVVRCHGPDGLPRWAEWARNAVTNAALDDFLNVYFRSVTQTAAFFIGLVDNAGFTQFQASDTMASHSGWVENAGYSNATRLAWTPAASSSQAITNTTTVDFNVNAVGQIRGLFLGSNNTKGGTTGLLVATASFTGGVQAVGSGDTLKVTYTMSAATA